MRKTVLLSIVSVSLFLALSASAQNNVVVVPLGSSSSVSINPNNIVSIYLSFHNLQTQNALTVPAGKHFVLTSVQGTCEISIKDNSSTTKTHVYVGHIDADTNYTHPNPVYFSPGIAFGPGETIKVTAYSLRSTYDYSNPPWYGFVTLMGYYY